MAERRTRTRAVSSDWHKLLWGCSRCWSCTVLGAGALVSGRLRASWTDIPALAAPRESRIHRGHGRSRECILGSCSFGMIVLQLFEMTRHSETDLPLQDESRSTSYERITAFGESYLVAGKAWSAAIASLYKNGSSSSPSRRGTCDRSMPRSNGGGGWSVM